MSSGCGDVLSLADLQTAKKHQIFEAEVITGKQGGVSTGASIDYATNQVTGQVQKTMPAILRDIGFEPASFDFTTGGTLTSSDRNKAVLWPMADGGDGDWYYWEGTLPKVIPAASTPSSTGGVAEGAWRPVGDIELRSDIASGEDNLGDALITVHQPYTGGRNRSQHDKNLELMSIGDFTSASAAVAATIAQTNAVLFNNPNAITLTVGPGGQFATLLEALVAVQRMKPIWKHGNGYCTIRLNTGYVHDQQIRFDGGVDLSWVRITSQDAVVYCNTTGFTESVRTYYVNKYMFYILNKSKAPTFFVQFEENRNDSDVTAFLVTGGATLAFGPRSGARKFYVGVDATFGAEVIGLHNGSAPDPVAVLAHLGATYYCCDFSYSRYTCARFLDGVKVNLPVSKFEYCQEATQQAVLCIYNVTANFHGSSASYSAGSGWNIRDNCHVNIRDHKTINCGNTGITSIHGAFIDARCHHTEESDADTSGQVLQPAVQKGLYGCAVGVRCESAAIVEVAGNDIRNCGIGVNSATGSIVSGKACDLTGCTLAFKGYASATQSFPRLWAKNVGKLLLNQRGCNFSTWTAHISMNPSSTQPSVIETGVGGESSFFEAEIDANTGIFAHDGASMAFKGCTLKVNALRSYYGSRMTLDNIDWDQGYKNSTPQLNISRGAFLNAQNIRTSDGVALTSGVTKNTLSISGAIFAQ